ncbi:hypothetical protein H2201_002448 [Coniosporium apollinis]|uniref:HMG box domain-containing protein n=2 Tax=Coniosporium TaxID=2810619 RepID=A0ABQ9P207_9PEZI|nr:hypothetical protein H2199_001786 [Cladosporium sp. JES 115]KAJ9667579.1 hypothetical protein H2201_002448 [Coniosporium apollinis]
MPKLEAPLSELTKDFAHIPLKDMNEWVNRSAEVRRQEVEKRNGYVTRPMNSFMLYRSAYAERTKEWCSQNNHQVVSSVSGESWPLEPPEIREMYNEYARIERINHQNAHPTYKFSPSKVGSARKRKGTESDEGEEESSDIDDPDADWGPPSHRSRRNRSSKRQGKELPYPAYNTVPSNYAPYGYVQNDGLNPSAWEATNEGRPPPAAIGSANMYNRYYQTTVHQNASAPGWEDVRMRAMEAPSMQHYAPAGGQSLIGLPGGQHHDLLQPYSHNGTPMQFEEHVDPMLLPLDGNAFGEQVDGMQFGGSYGVPLENGGLGEYDYRSGAWPVDPTLGPPLGEGSELDQLDG